MCVVCSGSLSVCCVLWITECGVCSGSLTVLWIIECVLCVQDH